MSLFYHRKTLKVHFKALFTECEVDESLLLLIKDELYSRIVIYCTNYEFLSGFVGLSEDSCTPSIGYDVKLRHKHYINWRETY